MPVPRPIAACDDPSVVGAPFFVMEALDGDAIRWELPPDFAEAPDETRHQIGIQVVDALAALHAVDPAAVGLGDLGPPSGYVPRQIRRWRGQLDHARVRPVPDLDWAADWLEQHQPPEPSQVRIVHGDYRLDNVIFTQARPPRLLGIVDWELATLGDPLADLGWLLAFWREPTDEPHLLPILSPVMEQPGFPSRAELAARYAEQTHTPLPGPDLLRRLRDVADGRGAGEPLGAPRAKGRPPASTSPTWRRPGRPSRPACAASPKPSSPSPAHGGGRGDKGPHGRAAPVQRTPRKA